MYMTDNQCSKEQALPHAEHHVLGNEFGLAIDESASLSGMNTEYLISTLTSFKPGRVRMLKCFQRLLGLMAAAAVV